jgi:hypothetical protein
MDLLAMTPMLGRVRRGDLEGVQIKPYKGLRTTKRTVNEKQMSSRILTPIAREFRNNTIHILRCWHDYIDRVQRLGLAVSVDVLDYCAKRLRSGSAFAGLLTSYVLL